MALTITDKIMRSGQTPHTATPAGDGWEVSWLPRRVLTRNQCSYRDDARAAGRRLAVKATLQDKIGWAVVLAGVTAAAGSGLHLPARLLMPVVCAFVIGAVIYFCFGYPGRR